MMLRLYVLAFACVAVAACRGEQQPAKSSEGRLVFEDRFDRSALGADWLDTSDGAYSIENGELLAQGARNKPLWLKHKLPRNSRVEFTARSASKAVDIKVELYGDGKSYAKKASYTATSYVVILGGWNNTRSIIARMDEHGKDRKVRKEPRGETGKTYRFALTRRGGLLSWLLDGKPFLELDDPDPLAGSGHEHLAINNWESEVYFDDLAVYEL